MYSTGYIEFFTFLPTNNMSLFSFVVRKYEILEILLSILNFVFKVTEYSSMNGQLEALLTKTNCNFRYCFDVQSIMAHFTS